MKRTTYKLQTILFPDCRNKKILNAMIDEQNLFDQQVRNDLMRYDSIRKIATGQGDDYTKGCLLGYNDLKDDKMIAIDLIK